MVEVSTLLEITGYPTNQGLTVLTLPFGWVPLVAWRSEARNVIPGAESLS